MDIVAWNESHIAGCVQVFAAAFAAEPWREHWPKTKVEQRLSEIVTAPSAVAIVAIDEGVCVGFACGVIESFHPHDRFQLAEMAVTAMSRPQLQRSQRGLNWLRSRLRRGLRGHTAGL